MDSFEQDGLSLLTDARLGHHVGGPVVGFSSDWLRYPSLQNLALLKSSNADI